MPNWCQGTLKIRGEKEDIVNFLKNGITSVGVVGDLYESIIEDNKLFLTVTSTHTDFYVNNTTRGFIIQDKIYYDYDSNFLALHFRQAWDIDAQELSKISKTYHLDFKIYAFERGAEFNRDIEIHKGNIIRDKVIHFDDYNWECICPYIGG